jgi:GntR family transcriptional regulator
MPPLEVTRIEGLCSMPEPAYVSIAAEYARRIRGGELPPGMQLPSYAEIAVRNGVSDIVVRKALDLLQSQGLVRSVRRRGVFVTDRPDLVRASPEYWTGDPDVPFGDESGADIRVSRTTRRVPATEELAEALGVPIGREIVHVFAGTSEDGRPISVSDTFHPVDITDTSNAAVLEETISDRIPTPSHAAYLQTAAGDLVKTIRQRYLITSGRVVVVSDVSYPRDRYDAFVFRITLNRGAEA